MNNILSPIPLAFIVIIVGYYIGQIKLFKISLSLSGILIVAIFVGWILTAVAPQLTEINIVDLENNMKLFSTLGTALFVSSIGISTGSMLDYGDRKDAKAIIVGALMVSTAFVTMKIISWFDGSITISELLGSLCGALTTTPGLSAACELENIVSEDVVLSYGCTYPLGVVGTVLYAQVATRKTDVFYENIKNKATSYKNKAALNGLIQIAMVIILGRIIGSVKILSFSLGNLGGILCSGIVISLLVKKISPEKSLTSEMLTPFRNIGLVLFFVGNGIPAGMRISDGVNIKIIVYGMLMAIIPIVIGTIFNRLFFKKGIEVTVIAGGMTSTPAIGVITEKYKDISLSRYVFAYFGALITTIIMIRM